MYQPVGVSRRLRKNDEPTPKIGSHVNDIGPPRQHNNNGLGQQRDLQAPVGVPAREGNYRTSFEKQQQQQMGGGGGIGGFAGLGNNHQPQYGRRSSANVIHHPNPIPSAPVQQPRQQHYQSLTPDSSITSRLPSTPPAYGRRAMSDNSMARGSPARDNTGPGVGAGYLQQPTDHYQPLQQYQQPQPNVTSFAGGGGGYAHMGGGYQPQVSNYQQPSDNPSYQQPSPQYSAAHEAPNEGAQYGRRAPPSPPSQPLYAPPLQLQTQVPPPPPAAPARPAQPMFNNDVELSRAERAKAFQREVEEQMLEARRVKEEEKRRQKEEDRLFEERVRKANEELTAKEKAEREREIRQKQQAEEAKFAPPKAKQKKLVDMPPMVQEVKPKVANPPPEPSPPQPLRQQSPPPPQPSYANGPSSNDPYQMANNNVGGEYTGQQGNTSGGYQGLGPSPTSSNGMHDNQFSNVYSGQQHQYGAQNGQSYGNVGGQPNAGGISLYQLNQQQGYGYGNVPPSPQRNLALYPPSPQRGYQEGEAEMDCEQDFVAVLKRPANI